MKKNEYLIWYMFFSPALIFLSLIRPLNYDEAYYTQSARYLIEGKLPYIDFLFHQPPLLIIAYLPFSDYDFTSLILSRIFSVILLLVSSYLFVIILKKRGLDKIYIDMFLILFFSNLFFIDWCVVIKIYSMSVLLISLIFLLFLGINENRKIFFMGIVLGFIVMLKLSFAAMSIVTIFICLYYFIVINKDRWVKHSLLLMLSFSVPLLIFAGIFYKYYDLLFFDLIQLNILMNTQSIGWSIEKLGNYFLVPQNFLLLLVILLSGFKYDIFESFIFFSIIAYILFHFPSQILPEYLTSIFPLLCILAVVRFEKFVNSPLFITVKRHNLKKAFIVLYLLAMPFGVVYLKYMLENREIGLNPIELFVFNSKLESLNGDKVLSSWLGYCIYSEKSTVIEEDYISSFIHYKIDERMIEKYNISTINDYKYAIESLSADLVIYDKNNCTYLETLIENIRANYFEAFQYKTLIVYQKKR